MVEAHWPELGGKRLRYVDRTWELTGLVNIRGTGELLELEATQVDDVRQGTAMLRFGLENQPASLNPGNLVDHFDELKQKDDQYYLILKTDSRRYQYELHGIQYQ